MIIKNFDLRPFNTFGLGSVAEQYLRLDNTAQLDQLELNKAPALVLGAGSNLLLLDRVPGLTMHINLMGISEVKADGSTVPLRANYAEKSPTVIRAAAGINWQQFVLFTLQRGLHGLENLALIPGTIGAAPVQNIGAYGVEVASLIKSVHVYEYGVGPTVLSAEDCTFGYRDSYFKQTPGRYLITAVDFVLGGVFQPNTAYGAIADRLSLRFPDQAPSPLNIARSVMEIRAEKLPFYSQLGNSGSFFKNPVISKKLFEDLQQQHPDMPAYPVDGDLVKVPAGWLIDQAGWKGKRSGAIGTFSRQALVIVNHGGATGAEVLAFSKQIQQAVIDRYGIELEREVRLVGTTT